MMLGNFSIPDMEKKLGVLFPEELKKIIITICEPCLKGEGEECHSPGCALFLHSVDLPFTKELYEIIEEYERSE